MKKLLTIIILFLSVGTANAQEKKPTLQETIKYINDILAVSIGVTYESEYISSYIKQQKFSLNEVLIERGSKNKQYNVESRTERIVYSNIDLSKLEGVEIMDNNSYQGLKSIGLAFSTSVTKNKTEVKKILTTKGYGYRPDSITDENERTSVIIFYVIDSKAENVKKALLHLKELTYKKDPFD